MTGALYKLGEYTGNSIGTNSASEHSGEESDGYTSEEDANQPLSEGARTKCPKIKSESVVT